jgi:hypothetical protein
MKVEKNESFTLSLSKADILLLYPIAFRSTEELKLCFSAKNMFHIAHVFVLFLRKYIIFIF